MALKIPIRGTDLHVLIDAEFLDLVIGGKLNVSNGYAQLKGQPLHQMLFRAKWGVGPDRFKVIDHINQDKLDNTINNLRLVSRSINALNSNKTHRDKWQAPYKGVNLASRPSARKKKKWRARIHVEGVEYSLGYFETAQEASMAYDEAHQAYINHGRLPTRRPKNGL